MLTGNWNNASYLFSREQGGGQKSQTGTESILLERTEKKTRYFLPLFLFWLLRGGARNSIRIIAVEFGVFLQDSVILQTCNAFTEKQLSELGQDLKHSKFWTFLKRENQVARGSNNSSQHSLITALQTDVPASS